MTLWTPPRKSLRRAPRADVAQYVASGYLSGGNPLNLASTPAQSGDLLLVVSSHENVIPVDFNRTTVPNWGNGLSEQTGWKLITTLDSISFNDPSYGANVFGVTWIIMRGPTAAALRNWGSSNVDTINVLVPDPYVDSAGYLALVVDRTDEVINAAMSGAWTTRLNYFSGVFMYHWWTNPVFTPGVSHSETFSNFPSSSVYYQVATIWELRNL